MGLISNGTTIFDAGALDSGVAKGAMTLIKTITISSDTATVSFIHGTSDVVFDSTYKEYVFKYINCHPASDDQKLVFQATTNGSNFNTTVTNTYFLAQHTEADNSNPFTYSTGDDQAQGTAFQRLNESTGADADQSISGYLCIFEPSSTTFVKHYSSRSSSIFDQASDVYGSGYFNTTSAITGIQFKFDGASIGSGSISLYGIN
jgi:hypothetical protein